MFSTFVIRIVALLVLTVVIISCEGPNPQANTPTSGRLVLFVDEVYVPLLDSLSKQFIARSPNARIDIVAINARKAVEEMIRAAADTALLKDTTASVAIVIGRPLLADELAAVNELGTTLNTYVIGHDGIAAIVAPESQLRRTTVERLRNAMKSTVAGYPLEVDSTIGETSRLFLMEDQNSSTFMVARRRLLADSNIAAPARYFESADSVVDQVASGAGLGIVSWYRAQRDSARVRQLRIGYTDSAGKYIPPTRVHVTTLVTDTYPLKQPLIGYTLATPKSLAIGFLTWIARSNDGQGTLVNAGLQPENMKIRVVLPDEPQL
jgi:DNA-binding transcriptional LysR family regulator